MALLFEDGFGKYTATASNLDRKWTRGDGAAIDDDFSPFGLFPSVRLGPGAAVDSITSNEQNHPAGAGTFGGVLSAGGWAHVAFWMNFNDMPNADQFIFSFGTNLQASSSVNAGYLALDNNGALRVRQHGGTTVITGGTSANGVIIINQWHHVEMAAKWNTAANGGKVKVWVDGTLVIDTSGDAVTGTVPSTITTVRFEFGTGSSAGWVDDVVVWDETGTDFVHQQIGPHRIEELTPDANDSVQFTPSAGSNFQNVDDPTFVDTDTTYNDGNVIGDVDVFTLSDLSSVPVQVFACVPNIYARKTDIGGVQLRTKLRHGSSDRDSNRRTLAFTGYLFWCDYTNAGLNPATGLQWGASDPNTLKIGYVWAGDTVILPPSGNQTLSTSAPTVA